MTMASGLGAACATTGTTHAGAETDNCKRVERTGTRLRAWECEGDQPAGGTDIITTDMLLRANDGPQGLDAVIFAPPGAGVRSVPVTRDKRKKADDDPDDRGPEPKR